MFAFVATLITALVICGVADIYVTIRSNSGDTTMFADDHFDVFGDAYDDGQSADVWAAEFLAADDETAALFADYSDAELSQDVDLLDMDDETAEFLAAVYVDSMDDLVDYHYSDAN